MSGKKYISIINKGGNNIYIKDAEVRNVMEADTSTEYVDLGLPSGILWAKCNIGADSESSYGDYFAWGEVSTKTSYTTDNYTAESISSNLTSENDAASVNVGNGWRMPSKADFEELRYYTDNEWTSINGINGIKFINRNNSNLFIFLPASGYFWLSSKEHVGTYGYYWTSSYKSNSEAWKYFLQNIGENTSLGNREYGMSIRPVRDTTPLKKISVKADKVDNATDGNFAGLNSEGNLTDSGYSASSFAAANHTHSNKADKVSGATNNNLAALNSNGNLKDSGYAASDFATANALIEERDRAQDAEEGLLSIYVALTQSDIVVTDILPASGEANTIYRVPDSEYESYSDYMYYNNAWKLMATYTNPMDHVPTEDSLNLVFSGGVYEWGAEAAEIVADPAGDWDPGTAEEYFEQIQQEVTLLTTIVQSTQLEIGAVQLDLVPTENSGNFVNSGGIYTALTEKYDVQPNGIPSTDMSSAVQASLTLADNSAQVGEVVATVG